MNKKILSIFVMIMALSLFGVSCSNNSTTPNNSDTGTGGGTTTKPTIVDKASLANAIKAAFGTTLNVDTEKTMKTDNTIVALSDGTITITITDNDLTGSEIASKAKVVESLNAKKAEFKKALTDQGLIVDNNDFTFAAGSESEVKLPITVSGAKVSSKGVDATKFTLPTELKDKETINIKLELNLGETGTWKA